MNQRDPKAAEMRLKSARLMQQALPWRNVMETERKRRCERKLQQLRGRRLMLRAAET